MTDFPEIYFSSLRNPTRTSLRKTYIYKDQLYNPDHLFGFVSVFNPDAIKSVFLIMGGFPARYGGRISSIVNDSMKEGNIKEAHAAGSISLISSKLMAEGPIVKDRSSYLVSARRSWLDLVAGSFLEKKDLPVYYFYDLTIKILSSFYSINYFQNLYPPA